MAKTNKTTTRKSTKSSAKTDAARAAREAQATAQTAASEVVEQESAKIEAEQDETDTRTDVAHATPEPEQPVTKKSNRVKDDPVLAASVSARRGADYFAKMTKRVARWDSDKVASLGLAETLLTVAKLETLCMQIANDLAEHAGADVMPEGKSNGSSGGSKLAIGDKVKIRAKYVAKYAEALEEEELSEPLVVAKLVKSQVVCNTCEGARIIVPRGQVERV